MGVVTCADCGRELDEDGFCARCDQQNPAYWERWDFDLDEDDDDAEDEAFDCSMFAYDGVWMCQGAGSEMCDWECPNRESLGMAVEVDEQLGPQTL